MQAERNLLQQRLQTQLSKRNICAEFFEYESGEDFLAATKKEPFSVLFLDIYMTGITGMETASELRTFDTDCLLIFTTISTDHALEGFRVRAMHYLVKPYSENELDTLTDEILERLPKPDKYMDIKVNGSDVRLCFGDIVYAEHLSHMIHIHTASKKTLIIRQSFGDFITPLKEDNRFFPCNRGGIVNLEHAIDFDGTSFLMNDNACVPVSRSLLKTARQTFMNFLFQRRHQK